MSDAAPSPGCLYLILAAGRERHEELIERLVAPVAWRLRERPELHALFFVRYDDPSWHLRFRVLGRRDWIDGPVRRLIARTLEEAGPCPHEEAAYEPETERYGGPDGVALAERLFLHDTLACLELMECERAGALGRTRREHHLLLTERLLDLMALEDDERLACYRLGFDWTAPSGTWSDDDRALVETRYQALAPGLEALLEGASRGPSAESWGGERAAAIADAYLAAAAPIVAEVRRGHDAGTVSRPLRDLACSYAHMAANRLGIEPSAEAILRYFMYRHHGGRPDA